ncbi:MAG: PEP-CTERM sorting domain-containing protein [Rugosibacter sp.]
MKLKMKLMAAAVALAASAGANAAMDTMLSGNSSLAFIALDSTGSPISMVMDLGINLTDFLPTAVASNAGYNAVWNFNTNTRTVNGVAQAGDYAWSNALSTFYGTGQNAETKWGVIAGDSLSDNVNGDQRFMTTTNTALATIQQQSKANLSGFSTSDSVFTQNNLLPSHTTNAEGGSTATSGTAYVGQSFGTAGKWANKATFVALAAEGVAQNFYMLDTNDGIASNKALVTQFANSQNAATFSYANGILTYSVAAVPEPSEYALMLAGLGMIGFMARRRINNRA